MKQFIFKSAIFILPIVILQIFTYEFYSTGKGDLLRLGYIFNSYPSYRDQFKNEFKRTRRYDKLSDQKSRKKYKILTIGDSFSEQGNISYQNYVSEDSSILHFDRKLHENPIQTLYSLLNGDFFNHYQLDYVVLQSVERHFFVMSEEADKTNIINLIDLQKTLSKPEKKKPKNSNFYSDKVIKFPYYAIQYFLQNEYTFPQVYRAELMDNLFSVNRQDLLFFHMDIEYLKSNNDITTVANLNANLNNLATLLNKRGMKLIVLPAPDKYDLYYQFLLNKNKYPKPLFFNHLDSMEKKYLYINSKKIISEHLKTKKDLYFYDDTHWSPWSSMLIGQEIAKITDN